MKQQIGVAALCCVAMLAIAPPLLGAVAAPLATHSTYTIVVDKLKFATPPSGLRVGDTVIWVNRDIFRHSATARDGSFNVDLMPGKSLGIVLKRAGTVPFYCTFHPGMKGQLVIAR
jgi:plastocyanin